MNKLSSETVAFFVSLAVLSFVYGYASRQNGLFPDQLIRQAQQEASNLWYRPSLTTRVYDRHGVRIPDTSAMQPGLTFINSLWKGSKGWYPGFKLIDRHGEALHTWRVDRGALFPDSVDRRGDPEHKILHGSHLFPNGDVLFNAEYVGAVRIDACGEIRWRLPRGNHHSVERAEDGTFWIPGLSERARTRSDQYPDGFPGLDDPVWLDQIHHVSAEGTLLERINVLDVLYSNDLERYIVKAWQPQAGDDQPRATDITHLNDVEPLSSSMADEYPLFEAGDLLVSLRKISLVFVFDPATRTVKWYTSDPLIMQHDPDFVGDGWIGIFDNNRNFSDRGRMLGGSRIVAVQPRTDSLEIRFPTPRSELLYTDTQGMWQQLPNGNMLLAEAKAGRVLEVSPNGRTTWEWIIEPYDKLKVSRISEVSRHDLTRRTVASWPCSSVDSTRSSP
ncbi:MAG: arylsulfotransferase family protein [Salinibacter sp.]|uniref:arylsulfotransferase family protein n=1 Tax=Salinibacter sp. TaxID=2065818 RepID=UPI0035D3FF03